MKIRDINDWKSTKFQLNSIGLTTKITNIIKELLELKIKSIDPLKLRFKGKRVSDGKIVTGWLLNASTIGEVGEELKHYNYSTVDPSTIEIIGKES